jgi:hypothetical protein
MFEATCIGLSMQGEFLDKTAFTVSLGYVAAVLSKPPGVPQVQVLADRMLRELEVCKDAQPAPSTVDVSQPTQPSPSAVDVPQPSTRALPATRNGTHDWVEQCGLSCGAL